MQKVLTVYVKCDSKALNMNIIRGTESYLRGYSSLGLRTLVGMRERVLQNLFSAIFL